MIQNSKPSALPKAMAMMALDDRFDTIASALWPSHGAGHCLRRDQLLPCAYLGSSVNHRAALIRFR
jgi:hypothetical protein